MVWVVPCCAPPMPPWTLLQVDEQLYQLQHERADLLKRIDEDQEDLNELMAKHKALIAQVGVGAGKGQQLLPWDTGKGPQEADDVLRGRDGSWLWLLSPMILSLLSRDGMALVPVAGKSSSIPLWILFSLSFTLFSCRVFSVLTDSPGAS